MTKLLPEKTQFLCKNMLERVTSNPGYDLTSHERLDIYRSFGISRLDTIGYAKTGRSFSATEYLQFLVQEHSNLTVADYTLSWLAVITSEKVIPVFNRIWAQLEHSQTSPLIPQHDERNKNKDEKKSSFSHLIANLLANTEITTAQEVLNVAKTFLQGEITVEEALMQSGNFYLSDENIERIATYDISAAFITVYKTLKFVLEGPITRIIPESEPDDYLINALEAYCSVDKNPPGTFSNNIADFILNIEEASNQIKVKGTIDETFQLTPPPKGIIPIEYDLGKKKEFWEWWLTEAIPQAWELAHSTLDNKTSL